MFLPVLRGQSVLWGNESKVKRHLVFISVSFPFRSPSKFFPLLERCEECEICLEPVSVGLGCLGHAMQVQWVGSVRSLFCPLLGSRKAGGSTVVALLLLTVFSLDPELSR